MQTIRVWDLPTRLFHWLLAAAVVGLVITANVGGNADLDAGRDIVITALGETSHTTHSTSTKSWNTSSSEVTTIDQTKGKAAGLNVGGNLGLKSGGNTTIKGSDVTVGGDLDVKGIGGNLEVTTFEETTNVVTKIKQKAILGGKVNPRRTSRSRRPKTAVSTVTMMALKPAALARCTNSRDKPRSFQTYS